MIEHGSLLFTENLGYYPSVYSNPSTSYPRCNKYIEPGEKVVISGTIQTPQGMFGILSHQTLKCCCVENPFGFVLLSSDTVKYFNQENISHECIGEQI